MIDELKLSIQNYIYENEPIDFSSVWTYGFNFINDFDNSIKSCTNYILPLINELKEEGNIKEEIVKYTTFYSMGNREIRDRTIKKLID